MTDTTNLRTLSLSLEGELLCDDITLSIYSTDASVYSEKPLAVAWPSNTTDIKKLIAWCGDNKTGLTVRGAGTSLAGQVVGKGIIADISRHMNRIIEFNALEKWVLVEPGVVLDELNLFLKPHGLFFGPETSTSNRCNIGGMVGNNACGLHSLVYGSTREHIISLKCILSDGSEAYFTDKTREELSDACKFDNLEGKIYRELSAILSDPENARHIREGYPESSIPRRNTGYCLDIILDTEPFTSTTKPFNIARLVAGSEGTLAIATEIKLNLVPLPPTAKGLLCVHLSERHDAFQANLIALEFKPSAVEMMDDRILRLTENNLSQRNNRFFISGEPGAILIVEINAESMAEVEDRASAIKEALENAGYGYHFPLITGSEIARVWELRKAGLGVLSNMKGDARPVSLIEDTAVSVRDLPQYMEELSQLLNKYGRDSVLHAHIGTGELHVRPVLNLKDKADVDLFRRIASDTALLVKKYRGSLSGEHGDGRLRGEFIPVILGEHNYKLIEEVKRIWDPLNILNPGIIVNSVPMNSGLRYDDTACATEPPTIMDFSDTGGIRRAAEKCNGSADCRKTAVIGGVMCPSFMATGDERLTTRARANILREYLPSGDSPDWDQPAIAGILDLCLSCKGCKAECPSSVDMAKMKAEFLQHWHDKHGIPLRSRLIAHITSINKIASLLPFAYNLAATSRFTSKAIKRITGFATGRSLPLLYKTTLRKWVRRNLKRINPVDPVSEVCLFIDEFTDFNDTETGIKAIKLLTRLNYRVITIDHEVSGRTFISKGLIRKAAKIACRNTELFWEVSQSGRSIIGIEPSAILTFRDEYPDLVIPSLKPKAISVSRSVMTFEEFIVNEYNAGRISKDSFNTNDSEILVHTHCQQKAISGSSPTIQALTLPGGNRVREIHSGCCGMAGSFGFEKEHFELSNKIGELILFPEVRAFSGRAVIAAPGTSCRHHILDGTGEKSFHPAVILYEALLTKE